MQTNNDQYEEVEVVMNPDFSGTSEQVANSLAGLAKNLPAAEKNKSKDSTVFSRFSKKSKPAESRRIKEHKHEHLSGNHLSSKLSGGHMAVISKELSADNVLEVEDENEPKEEIFNFQAYIIDNPDKAYAQFLQAHKCHDVIPINTKFVVLDISLPVRKAFHALIYNGVRSALLWSNGKISGILSVTDFIHILLNSYKKDPNKIAEDIESHRIEEWRAMLKREEKLANLIYVNGNESLLKAVMLLIETKYHRIPILDEFSDNPLFFLTHKRILRFLYLFIDDLPTPSFMSKRIRSLGVGTYDDLLTINPETPLIECLSRLISRNLSALPVITKDGYVVDIYARFDAIAIAAAGTFDKLNHPVSETLAYRKNSKWYKGVVTCLETDSVRTVMDTLMASEVHGLVVVDENNKIKGVVTLFDILKFVVVQPFMQDALNEKTETLRAT